MSGRSPSRFPETVTCGTHKWTRKILIHSVIVCWLVFFFFLQRVRTHLEHVGWFQVHPTSVRLLIKKICSGFFFTRGCFAWPIDVRRLFGWRIIINFVPLPVSTATNGSAKKTCLDAILFLSFFYFFYLFLSESTKSYYTFILYFFSKKNIKKWLVWIYWWCNIQFANFLHNLF